MVNRAQTETADLHVETVLLHVANQGQGTADRVRLRLALNLLGGLLQRMETRRVELARNALEPAKFIILNAKFLVFNAKFLVFNTQFLVLKTKFLVFNANIIILYARCAVPGELDRALVLVTVRLSDLVLRATGRRKIIIFHHFHHFSREESPFSA